MKKKDFKLEWYKICRKLNKSGYDLSLIVITNSEVGEYYESKRVPKTGYKN